jgi:hypothetical protein
MFRAERDYESFQRVMLQARQRFPLRICAYCILSNHWHFVAWPEKDGELTEFFRWLTHTHAMRWRVSHRTVGYGPFVPGAIQKFSGSGGCVAADRLPVCGAQRAVGGLSQARPRLAMGQPVGENEW